MERSLCFKNKREKSVILQIYKGGEDNLQLFLAVREVNNFNRIIKFRF